VKKFGLAAILTFVDKGASRGMGRVGRVAANLQERFRGIGRGVAQLGRGLGSVATSLLPVSAGFGFMIRDGMKFEQSMANLKAVTLDVTGKVTAGLKGLAKTMGATTKFSASEAADAMTNLARGGLKAHQVAQAIPGTLAAAAAEGIDLATAADMVVSNMKGFHLEAKKAATVAGSLALVSARTNTNMVSLQEGMKLAAPTANLAGFAFKDTALALGSLADIGLKGTLAGTALRGAMSQILSPTKKVLNAIGGRAGLNEVIRNSKGELKPMSEIMLGFAAKLRKIPDRATRVDTAMKVFGKRAVAVMSAFNLTGAELDEFRKKQLELQKETGSTAEIMKALQMKTLGGQLKLVRSAVEAVNIELYGLIASELRVGVGNLADNIGKLSLALRVVRGEKFVDEETKKQVKLLPQSFLEAARGIKEGFAEAKVVLKGVWDTVKGVFKSLGFGTEEGTRGTAKMITKFATLAAVFAPLGLAIAGATKLFGGLANVGLGAAKVVGNTLALATRTAGGVLATVGSKIPRVGGLLGKLGGLLGKAGRVAEKATAQRVYVVNFDEAGIGGLGGGALPGQLSLPFGGAGGAGGLWAKLSALGKMPVGVAFGKAIAGARGLATSAAKLAARFGPAGIAVAAAGYAGWRFGKWLDQKFGISDKLANSLYNLFNASEKAASKQRVANFEQSSAISNAIQMANTYARLSQKGVKTIEVWDGAQKKRVALTQQFAQTRISEFLQKQNMSQAEINRTLSNLAGTFRGIKVRTPGGGAAGAPKMSEKVRPARDAFVTGGGFLPVSAGDVLLDRASLAQAVVSQMRGGLIGQAGAGTLGGGDLGRVSPPPAAPSAPITIQVPVEIDGRQIAIAVAEVQLDELERGGVDLDPGVRRDLLERGFLGGGR